MKCRILKVQRPGMTPLYLPQYKGWFFWNNIPKHAPDAMSVRRTHYYYSIEEAEKGLRDFLTRNSVLTCEVVKEYEL